MRHSRKRPKRVYRTESDTAFHAYHAPLFTEYALPQKIRDKGIRRYGFHGLSYEWIAHFLRQHESDLARRRIIAAHLGNGASLCAMHNGISIDTTMGMTALDDASKQQWISPAIPLSDWQKRLSH